MAQENNPYYVKPSGDYSGMFGAIGDVVSQRQEASKAADIKKQAIAAYQSRDPDVIAQFNINNPEIAKSVTASAGFYNDQTEDNYIESLFRGAENPEDIPRIAAARAKFLESQGVPPEDASHTNDLAGLYATDPAAAMKKIETDLAVYAYKDPERYKAWRQAKGLDAKEVDSRTTAIKEFEYGQKNPEFLLSQKAKEDKTKTAANSGKVFENSTKLRKEFLDQSKEYQKVRDSYTRIKGSIADPSPAGDLSLIFNYMKMLDPGSVVRESEFAAAAASGSFGERFKAAGEKLATGERLTEKMRSDFTGKAGVLFKGMDLQHGKRETSYKDIAKKNGFDPSQVVVDLSEYTEEVAQDIPISDMSADDLRKIAMGGQ